VVGEGELLFITGLGACLSVSRWGIEVWDQGLGGDVLELSTGLWTISVENFGRRRAC